jgi:hypothetical protein
VRSLPSLLDREKKGMLYLLDQLNSKRIGKWPKRKGLQPNMGLLF